MDTLLQLSLNGLIAGSMYGLIGLSFGLIYSTTHFFHFAHGAVYSLAAYAMFAAVSLLGLTAPVAVLLAIAIAASGGAAIDSLVYVPLRKRKASPLVLLLASIGVFTALQACFALVFGSGLKILNAGILGRSVELLGVSATILQLAGILVAFLSFFLIQILLGRSAVGRLLRAVGSDPELARICGIEQNSVVRIAFVLGSSLVAVAAVIAAYDSGLRPTMGLNALLVGVVAVVFGGVGSSAGAFGGGLIVGFIQQFAAWVLPSRWTDLVLYLILFVLLTFRTRGIVGEVNRLREV